MIGVAIRAKVLAVLICGIALSIWSCQVIASRALPRIYTRRRRRGCAWARVAVRTRLHRLSCTTNELSWPIVVKRERQAALTDAHHLWTRGALPAARLMLVMEHASLLRVKPEWSVAGAARVYWRVGLILEGP